MADASAQTTVVDQVQYVHPQLPANNRPVMQFAIEASAASLYEAGKLLEAEALINLLSEAMVFSKSEEQHLFSFRNAAQQYRFGQARP